MKQLWEIFWSFFKIGLFTFGGGYAMIPLIQREVIDHRKWIPASEFLDLLTLAQSVPGPIAINTAVFVGYKRSGLRGACASLLGAVLPSFLIILAIALFFAGIRQNPVVDAAFKGMRPAVVALIIAPLVTLTRGHALEHDRAGRRTGRTDLVAGSFTGTDSCRRCRCRHRLGIVYRKKE